MVREKVKQYILPDTKHKFCHSCLLFLPAPLSFIVCRVFQKQRNNKQIKNLTLKSCNFGVISRQETNNIDLRWQSAPVNQSHMLLLYCCALSLSLSPLLCCSGRQVSTCQPCMFDSQFVSFALSATAC